MWTPHLEFSVTAPFAPGDADEEPDQKQTGATITLAVEKVALDGDTDTLTFRLRVAYALPAPLYRAYRVPTWAVQVVLERPETSQAATFPLVDPYAEYAPLDGPNFLGDPAPDAPMGAFLGERVSIDMAVPLPDRYRGPHVYATAYLAGAASNTLAIDADTTVVTSLGRR